MKNYLNFENEIKDLEAEIDNLKDPYNQSGLSQVDTEKISKSLSNRFLLYTRSAQCVRRRLHRRPMPIYDSLICLMISRALEKGAMKKAQ